MTAPIPDTPHETAGRQTPPGRRRLALGAALALVAGAAALFAATQPGPPPQAVETTTTTVAPPLVTTTTLGVELQGEPLELQVAAELDRVGIPNRIAQLASGELLLVGYEYGWGESRAVLLLSPDGDRWREADLPPFSPTSTSVEVIDGRIYAYGAGTDGRPAIWISDDAREWTVIPVGEEPGWRVSAVLIADDLVMAELFEEEESPLTEELVRRFGPLGRHGGTASDGTNVWVIVHLPLGIQIAELAPEELGLTPEDLEYRESQTRVMATTDLERWYEATRPPGDATRWYFRGPDGALWATAPTPGEGSDAYATRDGITWEPRQFGDGASAGRFDVTAMAFDGSYLVVRGAQVVSGSLREHLAHPDWWWFTSVTGNDHGLVAVASLQYDPQRETLVRENPTYEKAHQGHLIRLTLTGLEVLDPDSGDVLSRIGTRGGSTDARYRFDVPTQTLHLLDGEGRELVTFTVEELATLEREFDIASQPEDLKPPTVVLFSTTDACSWTVQDITGTVGRSFVTGSGVIDRTLYVLAAPWPELQQGQVLRAELPDGSGC